MRQDGSWPQKQLMVKALWTTTIIGAVLLSGLATFLILVPAGCPTPPTHSPCSDIRVSSAVFCNASESLDLRIVDLVMRLLASPVDEISGLMGNAALPARSISFPPYQWWSEGLHGVAQSPGVCFGGNFPAATSLPQVILTAASFNRTLFSAIGDVVGREGRAMNNYGHAGLTFWTPNINIYRDPRWGRGQETPGEDPFLTAVYAEHFVQGMQSSPMDPTRLRVSACCKHFLGYDLDDSDGVTRHNFDAAISEFDLNNTYLVAFQTCVHRNGGAASGVMCSYNAVNGVPSCANRRIEDLLRGEWGFDGYVTSDCHAVGNVEYEHHFTSDPPTTVGAVMSAGTDIACMTFLQENLPLAVADGTVRLDDEVMSALTHQFRVLMRLGMFDDFASQPFKLLNEHDVCNEDAQRLALEAAEQGIVLLQRNASYFPWRISTPREASSGTSEIRSVAVMGPNADRRKVLQGNYFGNPPYMITPLDALRNEPSLSDVAFLAVLRDCLDEDMSQFDAACEIAQDYDTSMLVVGNDEHVEGEAHDRVSIALPGVQEKMILRIAACADMAGKQVTVVVLSGGSVDLSRVRSAAGVGAVLWAGYPGQSGGAALANIVMGRVSPSGRLPFTMYPASFAEKVKVTTMRMSADARIGSPGFTYRYYTDSAVYAFGHGLSFVPWELSLVDGSENLLPSSLAAVSDQIQKHRADVWSHIVVGSLSVRVFNAEHGNRSSSGSSSYSVLLFVRRIPNVFGMVGGTLSDFARVKLRPGEVATVDMHVRALAVSFDGLQSASMGTFECVIDGKVLASFTLS